MHLEKKLDIEECVEHMKAKWESLGIAPKFSQVHHFSSDKFSTHPSGLDGFYNWCQKNEIQSENVQTVQRALATAFLYEGGASIERSIEVAWQNYGLVKR